mmetsp:Transcript_25938/g.58555  ORF Transcript_25938/g.58555 Transcript_25938/m.58555 type:complete len:148 (-) Transcript_25938:144-587(-)
MSNLTQTVAWLELKESRDVNGSLSSISMHGGQSDTRQELTLVTLQEFSDSCCAQLQVRFLFAVCFSDANMKCSQKSMSCDGMIWCGCTKLIEVRSLQRVNGELRWTVGATRQYQTGMEDYKQSKKKGSRSRSRSRGGIRSGSGSESG